MKLRCINIKNIIIILILFFFIILNNFACSEQSMTIKTTGQGFAVNSDSTRTNENILKINYSEAATVEEGWSRKGDWSTKLFIGKQDPSDPAPDIIWLKFDLSLLQNNIELITAKIFLFLISEGDLNDPPIFIHYSSDDSWTASSITGTSYPDYDRNGGGDFSISSPVE